MSDQSAQPSLPVTMFDIVFPVDVNHYGTMFGGNVMAMMDKAAYLAAVRFARRPFVTVSTDDIQFLAPIQQGDLVETVARVAWTGTTSVVAKVEVYLEKPLTGERRLCTRGWFVMAARDSVNRPVPVPQVLITTPDEEEDARQARSFRERSLGRRESRAE